eukprot:6378827-Pyramimonas_sp.AAC.1
MPGLSSSSPFGTTSQSFTAFGSSPSPSSCHSAHSWARRWGTTATREQGGATRILPPRPSAPHVPPRGHFRE